MSLPMEGCGLYLTPLGFTILCSTVLLQAIKRLCQFCVSVCVCTHVPIAALGAAQFISCHTLAVCVLEKGKMLLYC